MISYETWPVSDRAASDPRQRSSGLATRSVARRPSMGDKNPKNVQKQKKNSDKKKDQSKKTPAVPAVTKK